MGVIPLPSLYLIKPLQRVDFRIKILLDVYLDLQMMLQLSQPYFGPSVGVKPNTPKVGNLKSFGTPECLELDSKAQNTSH
jgi:hypothetical protein